MLITYNKETHGCGNTHTHTHTHTHTGDREMRVTLASETLNFTAENSRQRDELVAVWDVGFRRFRG